MEVKSLYTVKKIVETGNFQKAAIALNYAQSTITFQVRQLENELGIKLFEKSGNHMVLSEKGHELLPLMENVLTATEELLQHSTNTGGLHGTLKIALPESLMTYKMQPVLKTYKEKAAEVKLSLRVLNCYEIYDRLVSGDIDIAIHYDVRSYPQRIETLELATYPLVMTACPTLDADTADLTKPNRQKPVCHIQNDPNAMYLKILENYLKEKKISLENGMEVWSIEAIKQSVMSNLGIAYLPRFTVEEELRAGKLKECPMDFTGEMTAICAYRKQKSHEPAVQLFLETLRDEFRE